MARLGFAHTHRAATRFSLPILSILLIRKEESHAEAAEKTGEVAEKRSEDRSPRSSTRLREGDPPSRGRRSPAMAGVGGDAPLAASAKAAEAAAAGRRA